VHSTFYTDSINDLPLLEKVNHPVATNPDDRLRAVAGSAAGAYWTCLTKTACLRPP
jgi:phosphoserine phosphatase